MHLFDFAQCSSVELDRLDWWAISSRDLEVLACSLVGEMPGGWVRRGKNPIRIGQENGSEADRIEVEMVALAVAAKKIMTVDGPVAALRAAAFYHLRFQRIHPMVEANGRIGRFILAAQIRKPCKIDLSTTLAYLGDWERDYYRVFETRAPAVRFELLLDLLARVTGALLLPESLILPASLDPLYPGRSVNRDVRGRVVPENLIRRK